MEKNKDNVKTIDNLRVWETKEGILTISIPRDTAIRMGLKYGDRVSVTKEP